MEKVVYFLDKYKEMKSCILFDCSSDCKYLKNEFINKSYFSENRVFF